MNLHGETKIELTDVRTGEKQVVKKHNLITNALTEILNGCGGTADVVRLHNEGAYGAVTLADAFYGGLLLYDTTLGTDADTLFAPAAAGVTGSAVKGVINTTGCLNRGSYNSTESVIDPANGLITYVYDFTTSQCNGVIASVCLTSLPGGYANEYNGALSATTARSDLVQDSKQTFLSQSLWKGATGYYGFYNNARGKPLWFDPDTAELVFAGFENTADTTALRLTRVQVPLHEVGIFTKFGTSQNLVKSSKTYDVTDIVQCFTTSTTNYYNYRAKSISVCCDFEAGKLYVITTPQGGVKTTQSYKIRAFDIDTMEATDYEVPNNTGVQLDWVIFDMDAYAYFMNGLIYEGKLYVNSTDTSDSRTFRIDIADPTKVEEITSPDKQRPYCVNDTHDGRIYFNSTAGTTETRILNTQTLTVCNTEASLYPARAGFVAPVKGERVNALYVTPGNGQALKRTLRYNYLATINDLASPVEKTAAQTMKITYTLRKSES